LRSWRECCGRDFEGEAVFAVAIGTQELVDFRTELAVAIDVAVEITAVHSGFGACRRCPLVARLGFAGHALSQQRRIAHQRNRLALHHLRGIDAQARCRHGTRADVARTTRTVTAVARTAVTAVAAMASPVPAVVAFQTFGELDVKLCHLLQGRRTADIAFGRVQRLPRRCLQVSLSGVIPKLLPFFDGFVQLRNALLGIQSQLSQILAAIAIGCGQFGIQTNRLVKVLLGIDQIVLSLIRQAAAIVGRRIRGIQLNGFGKVLNGGVEILSARPGHAPTDVVRGIGRIPGDRLRKPIGRTLLGFFGRLLLSNLDFDKLLILFAQRPQRNQNNLAGPGELELDLPLFHADKLGVDLSFAAGIRPNTGRCARGQ